MEDLSGAKLTRGPTAGLTALPPKRHAPQNNRKQPKLGNTFSRMVDGVIAVFSPAKALERIQFRAALQRSYAAADRNRTNADIDFSQRDADSELRTKRMNAMAISREESRNDPIQINCIRTRANNVIGDDEAKQGIRIRAQVKNDDGQPDKEINKELDDLWALYKNKIHLRGRFGFSDLMRVLDNSLNVSGEALAVIHQVPAPDSDIPFSIEDLEPDHLPTSTESWATPYLPASTRKLVDEGNWVLDGIEYDKIRRIVAYHILSFHPGNEFLSMTNEGLKTERWPRERVIHYMEPCRPEQGRGMPYAASGLQAISDINAIIAAENDALRMQSALTGVHFEQTIANPLNPVGGVTGVVDSLGNAVTQIQPASFTFGPSKPVLYGPTRPNPELPAYLNIMQRRQCAANGISYSSGSKDYSGLSFSTHRGEQHEDRRMYRGIQGLHIRCAIKPRIWPLFIEALVVAKKIMTFSAADFAENREKYTQCRVVMPDWEYVNPQQEATADMMLVASGQMLPSSLIADDYDDFIEQFAQEKEIAENAGLDLAWLKGLTAGQSSDNSQADMNNDFGDGSTDSSASSQLDKQAAA